MAFEPPTLFIAATKEGTQKNLQIVFSQHKKFFECRGIKTKEELEKIINSTIALERGDLIREKRVIFSRGFSFSRFSRSMTGYSVSVPSTTLVKEVFDDTSPFTVAFLYAFYSQEGFGDSWKEKITNMASKLAEKKYWPSRKNAGEANVKTCIGKDRVISIHRNRHVDDVFFLYITTGPMKWAKDMNMSEYAYHCQNEKHALMGEIETRVGDFMREGDIKEYKRLWASEINTVAVENDSYVCYVGCTAKSDYGPFAVRNQRNGIVSLLSDNDIDHDSYSVGVNDTLAREYFSELSNANATVPGLCSIHHALVYDADKKEKKELDAVERDAKFRRENDTFKWCRVDGSHVDDTESIDKNINSIYLKARIIEDFVPLRETKLVTLYAYVILPDPDFERMDHDDLVNFKSEANETDIVVNVNNIPRIISFLTKIVERGKSYSFNKEIIDEQPYLRFSVNLLTNTKKDTENQ